MNIGKPIISVIVPVYQSESYLPRCVESILSQSLHDIELILVDDGSMDKSGLICEEYAQKDIRVHVFHKSHSGVSDTRQKGLENATGDYVIHCDSDDWMEPDMLEKLYINAQESGADMVVCDYWVEYRERVVQKAFGQNLDSDTDLSEQMENLLLSVWNKLIRRSFIVQNDLHFLPSVCFAEDLYFVFNALDLLPKIVYVPQPLYHYNIQNEGSLTHNVSRECFESQVIALSNLDKILNAALKKKLVWYKCGFLYHAFKNKYYSVIELLKIFPEVNKYIVPLALEYYGRKLSQILFVLYRSISFEIKRLIRV